MSFRAKQVLGPLRTQFHGRRLQTEVLRQQPFFAQSQNAFVQRGLRWFSETASDSNAQAPDVEELKAKIEEATQMLQELKDKLAASKADLHQATKRHQTDLDNESKYGFTKFALSLLHIPDNLERAIDSVKTDELDESKDLRKEVEGVKKIRHHLELELEKFGIHKMKALDAQFDPAKHEAMFAMEMPGKEANTIFHVMEPGYMIHERTLRAAKVGIAR
jgi:molecular chaperone GrpE